MARYINVFVDTQESPSDFASSLESILGIQLQKVNREPIYYEYSDGNSRSFDFGEHYLENETDLNFEDYKYQIEIGTFNTSSHEEKRKLGLEFAQQLFDALKKSGKYRVMLVDSIDIKLDEFSPY